MEKEKRSPNCMSYNDLQRSVNSRCEVAKISTVLQH